MFHTILYYTLYQLILSKEQRKELKRLKAKHKGWGGRFLDLVGEIMFSNDQITAEHVSRSFALNRAENRMNVWRAEQKEIDSIKENCRYLKIPGLIIRYESP